MSPTFTVEDDPRRFRERVWPFLELDPVERTLPMTVLDAVVGGLYASWVLAAVESASGAVIGCAVQTPPHHVIVAAGTGEDARALARGFGDHDIDLPGVVGLTPWVQEFAAAWCEGRARTAVEDRASRLFRLDALVAPRPAEGTARIATHEDLDLVVDWSEAFVREVGGIGPGDLRRSLAVRIAAGRVLLWVTAGEVVSFLGHSPVLAGHARIGPVYTPPEHRGRGCASNLVAAASGALLALDAVPTLFTDLANPTSNSIYRTIGYTPVADAYEIRFVESAPR
jgi:predicted GNAT family acetyltransferase